MDDEVFVVSEKLATTLLPGNCLRKGGHTRWVSRSRHGPASGGHRSRYPKEGFATSLHAIRVCIQNSQKQLLPGPLELYDPRFRRIDS
jgi:hypothetical protein